jgi:nitrate reductase NapE component
VGGERHVRGSRLSPWIWTSAVALAIVALPVAALSAGHAWTLPWADDWAYERMAASLERTGHLHFIGWNDVTLVGQLAWGVPWIAVFGPSLATIHWAGATAALAGLVGACALLRMFLPLDAALLGTAALGLSPLYILLAGTFMTDLPAFATEMWCIGLGIASLRSANRRWLLLAAALVVGAYGFTIRESALSAPLAVIVGLLVERADRRERLRVVGAAAVFAVVLVVFYRWRHGLAAPDLSRTPRFELRDDIVALCEAFMVIALVASPVAAVALAGRRLRFNSRVVWLGAAVSLTAALVPLSQIWYHDLPQSIFPGNLITQEGALGDHVLSGTRPDLFPAAAWVAIEALAVASGCVAASACLRLAATRRRRSVPGSALIVAYLVVSLLAYVGRADTKATLYDRYLLGAAVMVILVVLLDAAPTFSGSRGPLAAGAFALWLPALLSVVLLLDSAAYNRARWDAGERAVADGVPANAIDAGFEWVGYHHRGAIGRRSWTGPGAPAPLELLNVAGVYAIGFGDLPCVVVSDSPKGGLPLRSVTRYDSLGGLEQRTLYAYEVPRVCRALARR